MAQFSSGVAQFVFQKYQNYQYIDALLLPLSPAPAVGLCPMDAPMSTHLETDPASNSSQAVLKAPASRYSSPRIGGASSTIVDNSSPPGGATNSVSCGVSLAMSRARQP